MDQVPDIIEIEGLHTQFGQHVVHQDLNLKIKQGEVLAIVGGSGSGKTVLLRQILGLEQPAKGSVKIFGSARYNRDFDLRESIRNRTGVLFQQGALFSALTVYDNIALPLRELRTFDERTIHDLVMIKLNMVAIEPEHAYKMPANLSGGMIKRVSLARALALDPELLFLDEPTAGLDPELSASFVRLIQDMRSELDLTIVMVTHDIDTLIALSDRIAVLADKQVVTVGSLRQIRHHAHPFIESFFKSDREKFQHTDNREQSWKTGLMPS
ncbi:ABC transporter ATP-binding protein [Nitrosomonas sp.]|uniref:ABC transporter ATP-binding protein n=1 Tax=Nitrosomonas sp. TaxID=42353 RepID=UPI00208B932A|nr:ATP-binding cassette domain-containing protein [Nitrosomonas sp.]GJL75528.1 MAG: ABC transporter ATP-binding protein [Nitrosomonas sp.]